MEESSDPVFKYVKEKGILDIWSLIYTPHLCFLAISIPSIIHFQGSQSAASLNILKDIIKAIGFKKIKWAILAYDFHRTRINK